jgi:hypothetical protein
MRPGRAGRLALYLCTKVCQLERVGVIRSALLAVGAVASVAVVTAGPAFAGGSNWHFEHESYEPGETAHGVAAIAWEHNSQLGTPDDGPFYVYLIDATRTVEHSWRPTADAIRVGVIETTEGPVEEQPGMWVGPHGAKVSFTVPDLPDGKYAVLHCNDPCTTSLADITDGFLTIGPVVIDEPTTTTTSSPVVATASAPPQPDPSDLSRKLPSDTDPSPELPRVAIAGLVAVPLAFSVWRLRKAHPRLTTSAR